jgi:DNA-binding winged helix-turn-helix (wHTH) protein/tetratricopeptide (TPR) repeat protein
LFVFGDFELDEARFELRRAGQRVHLQPKVLKLLLYLVAHRNRTLPTTELLLTLWPGEHVGNASIKRAVRAARVALGESGAGPSAIRSVRGHGYEFALPVREQRTQADGVADAFIGREAVLSVVDAALKEVLSGHGTSLLFVGEPGIGKTRTLRELGRRASAQGVLACFGRCSEVDGAPALWPVIQILRRAMKNLPAAELRALLGVGAADIAQGIPELGQYLSDLPKAPEIDSVAARFRFFDSMAWFVRRTSERWPLAIVIDDLQRADQPTLQLLGFLAREIEGSRVLLAAATRPVGDPASGSSERWYRWAGALSTCSIELHGWNRSEVGNFLGQRLRAAPPEHVVAWLEQRTSGNPLFLEQILRDTPARCELCASLAEPCWHGFLLDTPGQGLQAAVDRHLQLLGEECRAMLRAAAVLGREFSLEVLTDIWQRPADHLLARLEEAVSAGVVQPGSGAVTSYRFAHVLIREALYGQLSIAERAGLHWQAGEALEARGAGANEARLSELAEHFVIGAPAHDHERALHYTLRAADAARRCLAYEDAARHLGRALELLGTSAEPGERLRVLLEQGEMLKFAGQAGEARSCFLHAAALARELDASRELARAAARLASSPEPGSVDQVQVDLLKQALAALAPSDAQRPCLQALLAKSLLHSRDPEGSAQLALEARAAAAVLPVPGRAETLQACHEALAPPSYLAERRTICEALTRIGHETGDQRILLRAATFRVWNGVELGDMAGVDAAIASLETLVEHAREPFFRWYARAFRAMRAMVAGRLSHAEGLAREAHELGRAVGEAGAYHAYCAHISGVLRLQGRTSEAEPLVRDISLRHPTLSGWRPILAQIEAELGRKEIARAVLDHLVERDLDDLRRDAFALSALASAAELCAFVGNAEQARLLYDATLPYERHHGNVSFGLATLGPIARHLGMLALRMGELERAEQHLERAIVAAERMPSPTFVALGSVAYVRLLLLGNESGARERATQTLVRAFELARECGMHALEHECRRIAERSALSLARARIGQAGRPLETIG